MNSHKLKIGISGLRRGKFIYDNFIKIPNAEVIAVMDPDERRLNEFCSTHQIKYRFNNFEDLLNCGIDAVVIASPMQFHAEQAIAALKQNIHVLSEVTAAISVQECKDLLQAVKSSKAQYMLGENYCYIRENMIIYNMVKQGLFGEVYYAEGEYVHAIPELQYDSEGNPTWRRIYQTGKRGCTYGTHSLGPVLQWFDASITHVNCLGTGTHTNPDLLNDDTTLMLCQMSNGGLIKVRLDMISRRPHNMRFYSLQGTEGCYEAPKAKGEDHKVWLRSNSANPQEWVSLSHLHHDFLPRKWNDYASLTIGSHHWGADFIMCHDFVESILCDKPVPIGIVEALEMTLPCILSEKSIMAGGTPIEVPDISIWKGGAENAT